MTYISWFKNINFGLEGNALSITTQNGFVASVEEFLKGL
jgi:hypothetical protein